MSALSVGTPRTRHESGYPSSSLRDKKAREIAII